MCGDLQRRWALVLHDSIGDHCLATDEVQGSEGEALLPADHHRPEVQDGGTDDVASDANAMPRGHWVQQLQQQ